MKIVRFFDRLEDIIRSWLSRRPILYGLIAGIGAVLFFRGIWILFDEMKVGSIASIVLSLVILLASGVFVSHFVGDQLVLSGLKKEKKIIDKTEDEVRAELATLRDIKEELKEIKEELSEIKHEEEENKNHGA
jgi:hypothetical protein